MAAQLLPPVVSGPFDEGLNSEPYSLRGSASLRGQIAGTSAPSANTFIFQRPRQTSPVSILSVASAPIPSNNENLAPLFQHGNPSRLSLRSMSSTNNSTCQLVRIHNHRNEDARPPVSIASAMAKEKEKALRRDLPVPEGDTNLLRNALRGIEKYKRARSGATAPSTPCTTIERGQEREHQQSDRSHNLGSSGFEETFVTAGSPDTAISSAMTTQGTVNESSSEPLTPSFDHHRKRLSTNSSGFVHTVKTASFSHGSFSLMTKSLRLGRSSETRALFSSHSRFSSESDRPPTNYSVDEAAFSRSVKRRQILHELVCTEETYIADMKALVYLMSTLLASANSISSRLRHSIQQNVLNLLHLHERILDSLHRAAFKSAARKWADTLSPKGAASPRHARWRTLEPSVAGRMARVHRRARSSLDSRDLSKTRARLVGADPTDVTDIIQIFRTSISQFFAYEEYCANHEIIAHDLQRHLPTLWSTYEAGIESLARSLVSIDRRKEDSRKALTVGDLLIKPIQRICKYPLLFEDLLKQTPVSDCPSTHSELESMVQSLKDIVEAVNHATHSLEARIHIHRRWSLQARLDLSRTTLASENLRLLGDVVLCGVLHVTYQTRSRVDGAYALCVLYHDILLVAFPGAPTGKFEATALINLPDIKLESASDGKGLSIIKCTI